MKLSEDELEQKYRVRVILFSLVSSSFILGLKIIAYRISQSTALKSDAIENIVNVVAAVFALGAVISAHKPPDREHPYGHGKIEYFSAVFEGGLISFAAVFIFYEALKSFIEGPQLRELTSGLTLNFLAGSLNGLLGWFLIRSGKKNRSHAIEADGHHVLSDFYTTLGITAGLILVRFTHIDWLDPAIAVCVGCLLAVTGYRLIKKSFLALLDTEDQDLVIKLVAIINRLKGKDIIAVHGLRTMRAGRFTHIDIHVAVPEFYPIGKAHDVVDHFGREVLKEAKLEGEFHTHVDPCEKLYCEECGMEPCPIRKRPLKAVKMFNVEEAVSSE